MRRQASEGRLRIARDLHDVVAHNISVINVQANTALHLKDRQRERAWQALATIHEVSKQAPVGLRRPGTPSGSPARTAGAKTRGADHESGTFLQDTRRYASDAGSHVRHGFHDLLCTALPFIVGAPKVILAGYGNPGLRDVTSGQQQTQRPGWHGCEADQPGGHQAPEQQEAIRGES
jgi:hypothetical protein